MHSLTKIELDSLLQVARKHSERDYIMLLVGWCHGMRASEICGLTAEHIRGKHIRIERLKGSETNVQEAHPDVLAFAQGKTGLLFGIKRRQFHNVVVMHCATAGIPEHKQHAHVLKHSVAHIMLDGGAPINAVQKRLGHRSLASTGRYLVVSDDIANLAFAKAMGQ